jgi:hypothetical protein
MILLFVSVALFGSMSNSVSFGTDKNMEKTINDFEPKMDKSDCDDLDDKVGLLKISSSHFHFTCKHFVKNSDTRYEDERNFLHLQPPNNTLFI